MVGTPLCKCMSRAATLEIVNALINQESIDINKARTDNGETPLYIAHVQQGHVRNSKCIKQSRID